MSRTILLADDSVTIQKVVELTFMEEDVDVVAVGSGAEAVSKLEDLTPSLVIADVHMPGPDGFELCRQVKKDHPAVPVLLLVGTFEAFDPEDVTACGADGYLKKPFDSQELMRQVEDLLHAARSSDTPVDDLFGTPRRDPATRERDLLYGVDDEIDALAGVGAVPDSRKPAAAPAQHPAPAGHPAAAQDPAPSAASPDARPEPEPAPSAPEAGAPPPSGALSDADVERIARRVVELMGEGTVREVAWEVVPDLAEIVIKNRLRELERQAD